MNRLVYYLGAGKAVDSEVDRTVEKGEIPNQYVRHPLPGRGNISKENKDSTNTSGKKIKANIFNIYSILEYSL